MPVGGVASGLTPTLATPPPAHDVAALFPGIGEYARTATRLHPRRGEPDPRGSHVGGPLRWPAGEPWPTCTADHVVATEVPLPPPIRSRLERLRRREPARRWSGYQALLAELASLAPGFGGIDRRSGSALYQEVRPQREPSPLVALAQLRVTDVPDLRPPPGSPPGTDLLQVLWCPNDHDLGGDLQGPATILRWRREADAPDVLRQPPAPAAVGHPAYLPRPCVLHPEQVVEYPWWQQLPADLGERVRAWDADRGGTYHRQLAVAPGWKVGGWPAWPTTDPMPLLCAACNTPMRPLLQLDSREWGGPTRWRPMAGPAADRREGGPVRDKPDESGDASEPTGVIAGYTGLYRIFTCPACPAATDPARIDLQ